jgi:hypothetical protein
VHAETMSAAMRSSLARMDWPRELFPDLYLGVGLYGASNFLADVNTRRAAGHDANAGQFTTFSFNRGLRPCYAHKHSIPG